MSRWKKIKGDRIVDLFNIICGVCSVSGLLVSLFTAGKVVKISNKVINKNNRNTFHGSYTGGDYINGTGSSESK